MLLLKGALRLEQQQSLRETFSRLPGRQHQTLNREVRGARGGRGGSPAPAHVLPATREPAGGTLGSPPGRAQEGTGFVHMSHETSLRYTIHVPILVMR